MLPDGVLSSQTIQADVLPPRDKPKILTVDYDWGPTAISDPSQGMKAKLWTGSYSNGNIVYSADGVGDITIYSTPLVNELSITFDQNGRPAFGFCDNNGSHLYWFDTLTNQYEVLDVGKPAYNPRVMLDDKRNVELATNDVLFCYLLSGYLYMRYQRERFQTEHQLAHVGTKAVLDNFGMNKVNRIQFNLRTAS